MKAKARKQCHLNVYSASCRGTADLLVARMQVKMRRSPMLRELQLSVRHVGAAAHTVQLDIGMDLGGKDLLLTLHEFQRAFEKLSRTFPLFAQQTDVIPKFKNRFERPLLTVGGRA